MIVRYTRRVCLTTFQRIILTVSYIFEILILLFSYNYIYNRFSSGPNRHSLCQGLFLLAYSSPPK